MRRSGDKRWQDVIYGRMTSAGLAQHWWRLDDANGTTVIDVMGAKDLSSSGLNSPTLNSRSLVNRSSNSAMLFATNQCARAGTRMFTAGNFTLEAIINPTSLAAIAHVIDQGSQVSGTIIYLRTSAGAKFVASAGTAIVGGTTLIAGTTYHIALTYDAARTPKAISYLDGVQEGTSDTVANYAGDKTTIGASALTTPAQFWNGLIDEVIAWPYAASADDLLATARAVHDGR